MDHLVLPILLGPIGGTEGDVLRCLLSYHGLVHEQRLGFTVARIMEKTYVGGIMRFVHIID